MPEPCPNPWFFGRCESTIEYLWRWTDPWERWVLYALALMLAYVVSVVVRTSYRCYSARRTEPADVSGDELQRARTKLIAELSLRVGGLKSVAAAAPYLGLVGACAGILGGFRAYDGTRHGFVVMVTVAATTALLSTAAGILVALPATFFYNFFRSRIESLETEVERKWPKRRARGPQVAQSLPLAPRFSKLPFAIVAVPVLALFIAAFIAFPSFSIPRGLHLGLAPDRCESQSYERVIVLHVTAGKILINTEEENWNRLAERLSEIYSPRADHTLYLLADDGVPVQTVADAIDVVNNISSTFAPDHLDIKVKLITPAAMKAHCLVAPPFPLSLREGR